jgi:probable rRNA maturation factor
MSMDYDLAVQVLIETDQPLPEGRLIEAVGWVLRAHETASGTGVSVVITDDDEIQQMNRQYRGVDAPTDVLSFGDEPLPGEAEPYLGDLILSLPYIQRQAEAEGHTLSDELALAVIHGTLHLLGYDHDTRAHQDLMWNRQEEALRALNVHIVVPRFDFPDSDEEE